MTSDGLARPIDFSARAGDGIHLGLSLGGGGVAWRARARARTERDKSVIFFDFVLGFIICAG